MRIPDKVVTVGIKRNQVEFTVFDKLKRIFYVGKHTRFTTSSVGINVRFTLSDLNSSS